MNLMKASNGAIAATYEYGPFGELLRVSGSVSNPLRFSTKYQDDETDLLYYGYRYYNATTGRWLSRDPIAERGGVNLNAFDINDMINKVDDLGLKVTFVTRCPKCSDGMMKKLKDAYERIKTTTRGAQLASAMESSTTKFIIICIMSGRNGYQPQNNIIYFNPYSFTRYDGPDNHLRDATFEQILGHEMGHANGFSDDGPEGMNNILKNENPIALQLA